MSQALRNEPITIYGDGSQTRSFQYVSDLVAGLMRLMDNDEHTGPFNIGNPGAQAYFISWGTEAVADGGLASVFSCRKLGPQCVQRVLCLPEGSVMRLPASLMSSLSQGNSR